MGEGWVFDRIFSSHAVRAKRTAEIACEALEYPIDKIQVDERVVEFSQGALEQKPRKEVYAPGGRVMSGIIRDAMFYRPPGFSPDAERGESQHDVEMRFSSFVDELLQLEAHGEDLSSAQPQTIAVFAHG